MVRLGMFSCLAMAVLLAFYGMIFDKIHTDLIMTFLGFGFGAKVTQKFAEK